MNAAKAIEQAMVAVLRQFAELGKVELRAWQTVQESAVGSDYDRHYPCVDVRCSPPTTDDNGVTLKSTIFLQCVTQVDYDKNHARASAIYGAVQGVCDDLYKQALRDTTGVSGDGEGANEIGVFDAAIASNISAQDPDSTDTMTRGGFKFAEGIGPQDEDGLNVIGISLVCHYSRSDF